MLKRSVFPNGPGPATSTRTFLNRFTYNLNHLSAPTLAASYDLRLTGSANEVNATQLPGQSMGLLGDGKAYFATHGNLSNGFSNSVLWLSPRQ